MVVGNDHQIGAALGLHAQHTVNGGGDQVVNGDGLPALLEHLDDLGRQLVTVIVGARSVRHGAPIWLAINVAHQVEQA
ncbi:hypothetical protein D3C85_1843490 [compost metagenome]